MRQVTNSRSYPYGNTLPSDHRPVVMDLNVKIKIYDTKAGKKNINFERLREDLKYILDPAELHIIKVLIENVQYRVRVGQTTSEPKRPKHCQS